MHSTLQETIHHIKARAQRDVNDTASQGTVASYGAQEAQGTGESHKAGDTDDVFPPPPERQGTTETEDTMETTEMAETPIAPTARPGTYETDDTAEQHFNWNYINFAVNIIVIQM